MARGTFVVVDDRFQEFDRRVERAVAQALFTAANDGAKVAREKRSRAGYKIEVIQSKTSAGTPRRTAKGSEVELVDPDYRALWFDLGTLSRRKRKVSKATLSRRASGSGQKRFAKSQLNPGVFPNRFLAAGIVATKKRFVAILDELLPG